MIIELHGFRLLSHVSFLQLCLTQLFVSLIAGETCTSQSAHCVCSYEFLKEDLRETILNSEPNELIQRIGSYECQQYREIPAVLVAIMNRRPPQVSDGGRQQSSTPRRQPTEISDDSSNPRHHYKQSSSSSRENGDGVLRNLPPGDYTSGQESGRVNGGMQQDDYPYGQQSDYSSGGLPPRRQGNSWGTGRGPGIRTGPQQSRGGQRGKGGNHPHFGFSSPQHVPPFRQMGPPSSNFPRNRQRRGTEESDDQRRKLENAIPKLPKVSDSHLFAFLGHRIQIPCNSQTGPQHPSSASTFRWIHSNGNPVSAPAASINEFTGDLIIPAVQLSDTDVYNCTAINQRGQALDTSSHSLSVVTDAIHWLSVEAQYSGSQCSPQLSRLVENNLEPWITSYVCPVCTVHQGSVICGQEQGSSSYEIKFALTAFNFENEIDKRIDTGVCPELCVQALHLLLLNIMKDSVAKLLNLPIQASRSMLSPIDKSQLFGLMTGCLAGFEYQYEICFPCLPGHYSERGDSVCMECSRGEYQSSPGASACIPCDASQDTIEQGASSYADCLPMAVVEAYYAAEKNSAAAIVAGVLFSILFFILLLLLLICCCCPQTKLASLLRKCFCFPCTVFRKKSPEETDMKETVQDNESRMNSPKEIKIIGQKDHGKGNKVLRKVMEKISQTNDKYFKPVVVKYTELTNPEATTTDEASELDESEKVLAPSEPPRKSVETQVKMAKRKSLESSVGKRQSLSPPMPQVLPKIPSLTVVEKGTNVPEKRRSSARKEPIHDDGELAVLTSEDDAIYYEEHTPRVKDTVAKINAASKFNKLYHEVSHQRDSVPKKSSIQSSGSRRNTLDSTRSHRYSNQDDETCALPKSFLKHSSHHKAELKSIGRFNKLYNDVRREKPEKASISSNPYNDTKPERRSRDEEAQGTRRFSTQRHNSLNNDDETSAEEQTLDQQWGNYCHTCIRPSLKRTEPKYSLPPPPPVPPE